VDAVIPRDSICNSSTAILALVRIYHGDSVEYGHHKPGQQINNDLVGMNKHRNKAIPVGLTLLLFATWCATTAFGGLSLTNIPTLGGDTSNEGRCITPDGQYVVGLSGASESTTSRGFLYQVGAGSAINIYSSGNAQATIATGVGYRTSGSQTELVIAGRSYTGANGYSPTEWMTTDSGATFGAKRRTATFVVNAIPAANSLGISTGSEV